MVSPAKREKALMQYAVALRKHGRVEFDIIAELKDLGVSPEEAKAIVDAVKQQGISIECRRDLTAIGYTFVAAACVVTFVASVGFTYSFPFLAYKWIVVAIAVPPAILLYVGLAVIAERLGLPITKIVRPRLPDKDRVREILRS